MQRKRFDTAKLAAGTSEQFRDLRSKAATDFDDVCKAQQLLGHASKSTMAEIYRLRKGEKVKARWLFLI